MQSFNYDLIPAGFYDEIFDKEDGVRKFWHWHKFDAVMRSLRIEKDKSLLDIGCFSGSFAGRFLDPLMDVTSVDILPAQIEYARKKFQTPAHNFICYKTITDLRQKLGSHKFDYITLIEVIEHLDEKQLNDMLELIYEVSHAGTEVVITTPNYFSLWPILEFFLNHYSDVKYEEQHIQKFTASNMLEKLRTINPAFYRHFEVEFLTSSHFITPFIAPFDYKLAQKLSRMMNPYVWQGLFGCLLILKLRRK